MKILLFDDNEYTIKILKSALEKRRNKIVIFKETIIDHKEDIHFEQKFENAIQTEKPDLIFSVYYYPVVSNLCNRMGLPYVSWVCDSPSLPTYSITINNSCNYIFLFDRINCSQLQSYGVKTVYHLPLAVDTKHLNHIEMTHNDWKQYKSDVSMMVNLYEKNFYNKINYLPTYLKGYLEGIMNAQLNVYGYNFLEDSLTNDIVREFKKYVKFDLGEDYFISDRQMISDIFLTDKLAQLERARMINVLSDHFRLTLYTGSDTSLFQRIIKKGYVDYNTEMPKVFKGSKININTSKRSIKSGIPLRALDIMGCGGFLISNYQQELVDFFVEDKEIVIYGSMDELVEKTKYYLKHEDERKEIAHNGYLKVKEQFNYDTALDFIFHTIFSSQTSEKIL